MAAAPKLKLAITAGIGSDHVDLNAAVDHKLTVAECTGRKISAKRQLPCLKDRSASAFLEAIIVLLDIAQNSFRPLAT